MSDLKWNWAYYPYLDPPEKQKESAQKAGYVKVVNKSDADKVIAELEEKLDGMKCRGDEWARAANDKEKQIVELKDENRKLKRALWFARAKRNRDLRTLGNFRKYVESLVKTKLSIYHYPTRGFPGPKIHKWMMDSFETWCKYLKIAEDKCLKKAEEYK